MQNPRSGGGFCFGGARNIATLRGVIPAQAGIQHPQSNGSLSERTTASSMLDSRLRGNDTVNYCGRGARGNSDG
ncbi:MAG: hypothetical protein EOP19_25380 [Hyphomicrobiales bacterium]|nr:MAG: hypothetical protein EOP19_25380 [Hyphomicrobiales bacterium]